ncbi:hypothetical protein D5041_17685 [Verminephrobacter aporrectodeae subsp. tuberculatae]|nr:hypothetical protein [Verminephrobacter aporrectodeae subsp. tuberculatae]MCW5290806.1 hypothetical protein [Verminephrobacter aporrectodeae subsp. tuberculatae]
MQGFAQSLRQLAFPNLPVPNYTTLSRRAQSLQVVLPALRPGDPLHLAVDNTGIKLYGEGEWKVRTPAWSKRPLGRPSPRPVFPQAAVIRPAPDAGPRPRQGFPRWTRPRPGPIVPRQISRSETICEMVHLRVLTRANARTLHRPLAETNTAGDRCAKLCHHTSWHRRRHRLYRFLPWHSRPRRRCLVAGFGRPVP